MAENDSPGGPPSIISDRFFKQPTVFTKVKNYFKRQEIQTQDSLDSNLKVATKDSLWYYSQLGWAWSWYEKNIAKTSVDRKRRYEEYNLMDQDAMISGAMDVYADEACSMNIEEGTVVQVYSENETVQEEVEDLFYKTLLLDEQVWGLVRDLCKHGDAPFEIVLNHDEDGVAKLIPIPIDGFIRIEEDKVLKGFEWRFQESLTDPSSSMIASNAGTQMEPIKYEPFQVAHFSVRTNDPRYAPYGMSILEGARKIWKQLKIMEDSLIINRLVRAPERRIFYIDVGNMGPAEIKGFINQLKQDYAKKQFYNPTTGEIDQQSSPLAQQEDLWIPTRESTTGNRGTRVETLPGANIDAIYDINYFRDKIMAALKIPPAYLGRLTGSPEGSTNIDFTKAGLSVLDKRFGRTIQRIQKTVIAQLYKIAYIHLFLKGFSAEEIKELEITMTAPSNIDELTKLELINQRLNAATMAKGILALDGQQLFPDTYIYRDVMRMSDEEIEEIKEMRKTEMPLAGPPQEGAPGGGGGGVAPAGGIEGEFDQFAQGKEGEAVPGEEVPGAEEVPGEEKIPGEEVPKVPKPAKAEKPESRNYFFKKPILANIERKGNSIFEQKTKYNVKSHFEYLLMEGDMEGLITKNGELMTKEETGDKELL
jgi:hypothetical protein